MSILTGLIQADMANNRTIKALANGGYMGNLAGTTAENHSGEDGKIAEDLLYLRVISPMP